MIASLPMYWRPGTAELWRGLWDLVRQAYPGDLPELTPPEALPDDWTRHWLDPDLVLSQTCSLPFRGALRDKVTYVGTLDYGLGPPKGSYRSHLIARPGRGEGPLRLAYNSADSQSGWGAHQMRGPGVPALPVGALVETGSHAASIEAVATGAADMAYIDAVTWRILSCEDDLTTRVEVLGTTAPTPGLPLITAKGRDPAPLAAALKTATQAFAPAAPPAMGGLLSFVQLTPEDYLGLPPIMAPSAESLRESAF